TYLIALGVDFSIEIFISALIGVFFIVLGNYMPKLQQNYTIGIKLPWTLNSEENWNRTHRLGGKLYIVMGIAMILMSFIDSLL
ncbi:SdpI family protein, partial [Escherichia coli]|nr:SdpI family protein [Escherichia coli]